MDDSPLIVVMTVNGHETGAVFDEFVGVKGSPHQATIGGLVYNDLGTHGGNRVVHSLCAMGSGGVGASQQRVNEVINDLRPSAVMAVGIAFGIDERHQHLGDVLVSAQLQDYELGRLNSQGTLTPRGDRASGSAGLRNRIEQVDSVKKRTEPNWPCVRVGLVLSGQKLVDNLSYRDSLHELFGEALGGEMEGAGLYVSAHRGRVEWIVVKAICDWGHSKGSVAKDRRQRAAARNAATVAKAAIEVGAFRTSGFERDPQDTTFAVLAQLRRPSPSGARGVVDELNALIEGGPQLTGQEDPGEIADVLANIGLWLDQLGQLINSVEAELPVRSLGGQAAGVRLVDVVEQLEAVARELRTAAEPGEARCHLDEALALCRQLSNLLEQS